MSEAGLSIRHARKGQPLPIDYDAILDSAKRAVAGTGDERVNQWMLESLGSISAFDTDWLLLLCNDRPAGIMSYSLIEDDAQIYFSYVLEQYRPVEGPFFEAAVRALREQGVRIIRTNFLWPSPERYIAAARNSGFVVQERLTMLRDNDAGYAVKPPAENVEIQPWSDDWLGEAGRLLFEEANPVDREIYPNLRSHEGTVADLAKITCNFYGSFLPGQSMVAVQGGKLIGLLLSTEFEDHLVLIAEIVVARSCRGRGVGGAMLGRVVRDSTTLGKRQIEVVVNAQNADAIRLYEQTGFKHSVTLWQHILVFK